KGIVAKHNLHDARQNVVSGLHIPGAGVEFRPRHRARWIEADVQPLGPKLEGSGLELSVHAAARALAGEAVVREAEVAADAHVRVIAGEPIASAGKFCGHRREFSVPE